MRQSWVSLLTLRLLLPHERIKHSRADTQRLTQAEISLRRCHLEHVGPSQVLEVLGLASRQKWIHHLGNC